MKGKSIASMVCGICSILSCWWGYCAFLGLGLGIAAVVLATGCIKEAYENNFVKAGKITGIIGIIISGLALLTTTICTVCYAGSLCIGAGTSMLEELMMIL